MHGRLLIAVTELFLFHILTREKRPEFCRSFLFRLGLQKRAVMRRYCLSLFNVGQLGYTPGSARSNTRARSPLVTNKKDFQALVPRIDRDKTPDSDVRFDQVQRRQGQDRHEQGRQCQQEVWFGVGVPPFVPEVSLCFAKGATKRLLH